MKKEQGKILQQKRRTFILYDSITTSLRDTRKP